jgi:hypothetical protein
LATDEHIGRAATGAQIAPWNPLARPWADTIDWTGCPDVERTPGKVSGQWIVAGIGILAARVTDNAEDSTLEEIDGIFPSLGYRSATPDRRIREETRRTSVSCPITRGVARVAPLDHCVGASAGRGWRVSAEFAENAEFAEKQ